ncbi:hypothetical protein KDX05_09340 [Burkholderia vietnamiensis]|uniref:hypothetical protein n=1 Tax=Burkholderia vietnamiensis TaxID=60552 RepID=UPI001593A23D|nr:hypothetical protein [Burkholderia vietnamiensis]MBR8228505.1 hypothetical protein [Burkholderia vietnamiensis]MCA7947906.1 hypothetical protein [Burkholderia vietnamiensis]HDR8974123.1 hypothetical protein [Burkholderia vietnamiensis]HDR9147618.1 hypothetical protein [Burkholderia vietnamiensis]HDR9221691.1 hypothetical protein [Burkholderia vietnamiensis]
MSRRQLLDAARRIGVRADLFYNGKRVPMNTEAIRMALLERLYGRNLGKQRAKTQQAMDDRILRGVACARGELGHVLGVAQMSVREGQNALQEYKRLVGLKRRRPSDEATALASARQWLKKASAMQDQYEAQHAAVQR